MRPRKGSGAERLGIELTGNPDAIETVVSFDGRVVKETAVDSTGYVINRELQKILENPGRSTVDSLS